MHGRVLSRPHWRRSRRRCRYRRHFVDGDKMSCRPFRRYFVASLEEFTDTRMGRIATHKPLQAHVINLAKLFLGRWRTPKRRGTAGIAGKYTPPSLSFLSQLTGLAIKTTGLGRELAYIGR